MYDIQGKYTTAKITIDKLDSTTINQVYNMVSNPAFTNPIAIMPDAHSGKGAVIGFTMELADKVIPNVIGVDIGCGMLSFNVGKGLFAKNTVQEIDAAIRRDVPFGTKVHSGRGIFNVKNAKFWRELNFQLSEFTKKFNQRYGTNYSHEEMNHNELTKMCNEIKMDGERTILSLGTLGGGNHFIEIGKSQNTGDYWVTIHSGSRQFGLKVATYWQRKAGKGELAFLEGENMFGYLADMVIAQKTADENRELMAKLIQNVLDVDILEVITSVHNFIDFGDWTIRKGAISAHNEEDMIIPFNMEDGLLFCVGRGNKEWNYSAPHGAGRLFSRTEAKKRAKETGSNRVAEKRMIDKGIFASSLPIDELKECYKDPKIIEDSIEPTAEIVDRVKPVLSMKDK
jgi:RNA-splicing ligase RtcB